MIMGSLPHWANVPPEILLGHDLGTGQSNSDCAFLWSQRRGPRKHRLLGWHQAGAACQPHGLMVQKAQGPGVCKLPSEVEG